MEIRNIITFVRIAELQNFSKAARQLGYSQSAVTMQIKQLEEELNAQLFDRIGKHIRLTQAGQRLLPHALEILDGVRRAQGITREPEEVSGRLRIGTAESLLINVLPPIIIEFSRLHPRVEISTQTASVADLFAMVQRNEIDLLYFLDRKTNFPEWIKVAERPEPAVFVASAQSRRPDSRRFPWNSCWRSRFCSRRRASATAMPWNRFWPSAAWSSTLFWRREIRTSSPRCCWRTGASRFCRNLWSGITYRTGGWQCWTRCALRSACGASWSTTKTNI